MFMDYVLNGQAHGELAGQLMETQFDTGYNRPYIDKFGRPAVTINTGRWTVEKGERLPIRESKPVISLIHRGIMTPVLLAANQTALRKEQWIQLDQAVLMAARQRLRAWGDLAAANTYGGFNGMGKMTLEYEAMSDPGEAVIDFDGLSEGRTDSPLFKLRSLPLPIIHSDYWFSERRLSISRNGGTPLDTTMAEAGGRRIAETLERLSLGVLTGPSYGGVTAGPTAHDTTGGLAPSQVYGYANFPHRITSTDITIPTDAAWHPQLLVEEFLGLRELLYQAGYFGPYTVYNSTDWDQYLDNDYFYNSAGAAAANLTPSRTLRSRLREIDGIQDVRRADFLTATGNPFTFIMVQMTSDVARAVIGMPITTVQWPSNGGSRINFKIMTIQVPQVRSDFNGNTGILHATTA